MPTDLDRFAAACVYPGKLDEQAVERELAAFLRALGMRRRIVRLRAGWRLEDDPPHNRNTVWILVASIKRNLGVCAFHALFRSFLGTGLGGGIGAAARHAGDAGDADTLLRDVERYAALVAYACLAFLATACSTCVAVIHIIFTALIVSIGGAVTNRDLVKVIIFLVVAGVTFVGGAGIFAYAFAGFGVRREVSALGTNWRGSLWELSWIVCALFDAVERGKPAIEARLRPLFEAFVCGCWLLYWADDALYWVAKPAVHREPGTRRLHHDSRAAFESDVVSLYFWQGVRVPAFVIAKPDLITIADIDRETNAEVRRAMIERYRHGEEIHGTGAFIRDVGGERLDHDERYGTLWRRNFFRIVNDERRQDDEPIVMLEVVNRTREPDGSFKRYWLRVPPTMQTAREAVAWTFNMPAEQYALEKET